MSNEPFQTGTYVKGDSTRVVDTTRDAVQAVFDGYTRRPTEDDVDAPSASVNSNDPEAVRTSATLDETLDPEPVRTSATLDETLDPDADSTATPDTVAPTV